MRTLTTIVALLTSAAAAGCTEVDTSPIGGTIPDTSVSASSRPPSSAGGRWTGLAAECPRLTSDAALQLGVAGAGAPTEDYTTNGFETSADCRWGSSDGNGTAVTARISIWARQQAADEQWRLLSPSQATALNVGDEGFVTEEPNAVVVRTRTGNAVATVRLIAATGASGNQIAALRQRILAITTDVLDDLVPA